MRLAFAATPEIAVPSLDWMKTSEHSLEFVITRPDVKSGRGNSLHESDVARWARENEVPSIKPAGAAELREALNEVDLVVTLAYGLILPADILVIPKFGFLNVHFSLLPAWRGAAPVQRAIENGDRTSGLTIFQLDPGMDTGPTYLFDEVEITRDETAGDLLHRLALRAPRSIEKAIEMVESGILPTPQPGVGISHAKKIHKEEARINWQESAEILSRRIRAFNPDPGSWTSWRDARIGVNRAHPVDLNRSLVSGAIYVSGHSLIVGCGDGTALEIDEIQPAGKRAMSAREWLNGARFELGDHFD